MGNKINRILLSILITIMLFPLVISSEYMIFGQNNPLSIDQINSIPTEIDGIKCDRMEQLQFHNHTLLVINNQRETIAVPEGIGIIPDKCLFWLHTHDNSGIIHVESPINITFTLDNFLQIWNKFDNSSIVTDLLNENINTDTSILFENNTNTTTNNYKKIELTNNSVIKINVQN